jgi:DNA-binding protein YbaB
VKRVSIDPALFKDDAAQESASAAGDRMSEAAKEMIEDLLAVAMNDANAKAEATSQQKMAGMTAGLGIPGLNLPF